jgi:hypothetical protein
MAWPPREVEVTDPASEDLRGIGGEAAKLVIGELYRLPEISADELVELAWPEPPQGYAWLVPPYAVLLHVTLKLRPPRVRTVAVVERVRPLADVGEWLASEGKRTRALDEEIAREEGTDW